MTTDLYPADLAPEAVAAYLRKHPDFFLHYKSLLAELQLPHESGQAISLVERQVSVLRDRSREMRNRLNDLLETARENDRLLAKTQHLVLRVLETETLDDLVAAVEACLRDEFNVDCCCLSLFGDASDYASHGGIRIATRAEAEKEIGSLLNANHAVCGVFRSSETGFLFPLATAHIASAAMVPLHHDGKVFGVLAIGSFDPKRYRSNTGTMFLNYVAEVINRCLPDFMTSPS